MKKLSVVIPVYNSQYSIENVVNRVAEVIAYLEDISSYEIILVNDASNDNSLEVCKEVCSKNKNIKLIALSKNFGQHNALMAGFGYVSGDYTVAIDDDLEKSPEDIKLLKNELETNSYDVVYGIPSQKESSIYRKMVTYLNEIMATSLINKPKGIRTSSFFIAKKFVINEMLKYDNAFPYIHGLIFRVTRNIGNISVVNNKREIGKSNYTLSKLISLWFNGFTNYSVKPLRISALLGTIFAVTSFLYMVYIIIDKKIILFLHKMLITAIRDEIAGRFRDVGEYVRVGSHVAPAPEHINIIIDKIINTQRQLGWTSLMAVVMFFGGVQLISLGLVGEYIGRIFLCINKTPQYVIRETYNLGNKEDSIQEDK